MRRVAVLLATVLVSGLFTALAPPAHSDTPHCVSRQEYRSVEKGWTRARVARVFDVPGVPTQVRRPFHARFYRDCWRSAPEWDRVSVIYRFRNGAWRVVEKRTDFWHA